MSREDELEKSIPPDDLDAAVLAWWTNMCECERLLTILQQPSVRFA
ncbi:MAG: hypothetical protein R3C17_11675 [Planctomycetaceae bacterium]